MAYYASNQPYHRVDSGGSGIMSGALMGAGAAGAATYASSKHGAARMNFLGSKVRDRGVEGSRMNRAGEGIKKGSRKMRAMGDATHAGRGGRMGAIVGGAALAGGIIGGISN